MKTTTMKRSLHECDILLKSLIGVFALAIFGYAVDACEAQFKPFKRSGPTQEASSSRFLKSQPSQVNKLVKTNAQWRAQLSSEEFYVTRQKGTETAYSGKYWDNKKDGVYTCKCCKHPLFDSKQKYDSKTGWPSYTAPKTNQSVAFAKDTDHNMVRIEVLCKRCDAHLGHVFDDGPQPTGQRFCMNSISLNFVPRAQWKKQTELNTNSSQKPATKTKKRLNTQAAARQENDPMAKAKAQTSSKQK